ncbi:MAG: hypothetical protein ACM31L_16035 [Actinomycetota bacterium]
MSAIFLSASVPEPGRGDYCETADVTLIQFAVSALVTVALGRRLIVWGGHPGITPVIRTAAEDLGVDYSAWVRLYQSRYFDGKFPDHNKAFGNVTYTDSVADDKVASLTLMRREMIRAYDYDAAVLIGGMDGTEAEVEMFAELQPKAPIITVASTGGAALKVHEKLHTLDDATALSLDYLGLFYRSLKIDPRDKRCDSSARTGGSSSTS